MQPSAHYNSSELTRTEQILLNSWCFCVVTDRGNCVNICFTFLSIYHVSVYRLFWEYIVSQIFPKKSQKKTWVKEFISGNSSLPKWHFSKSIWSGFQWSNPFPQCIIDSPGQSIPAEKYLTEKYLQFTLPWTAFRKIYIFTRLSNMPKSLWQ